MKSVVKFFALWIAVAAIPLFIITLIWVVTIGAFNLLDAVHSGQFIVASTLFCVLGWIPAAEIVEGDSI